MGFATVNDSWCLDEVAFSVDLEDEILFEVDEVFDKVPLEVKEDVLNFKRIRRGSSPYDLV